MPTIRIVAFAATALLGLVLCFIWWRERSSALIGWWGVAQLVMAAGIEFAGTAATTNDAALIVFGHAIMVLSAAIMWMAAREFEGRTLNPLWIAVWPCGVIIASASGLITSFDQRLILACTLLATLNVMAAAEFMFQEGERLVSRWPAIVLLIATAVGFLAWMPLTLIMPVREVGLIYASGWMPSVILIALLSRIALAFVILALVKEREEERQRLFAMTDPLTGLPNRRALFETAAALSSYDGAMRGDPIAVMVFDLDHFKKINDTYGHRLGDRVLQLFANTLSDGFEIDNSIIGRLGGEEFAAIMPGTDLDAATVQAEKVRIAFADAAAMIDGMSIAGTVSVGVAGNDDFDCDLGGLFHRADGALYAAKQSGRNRVQAIGPGEPLHFEDVDGAEHLPPARWLGDIGAIPRTSMVTRRYRSWRAGAA